MKDLEFFSGNKELENIIFDILIEISKIKDLEQINSIRFDKIINFCFDKSI